MSDQMRVLVTAGRFMPATGIVHALHKVGALVEVADSFDVAPALHSRYIEKAHLVPSPSGDPVGYTQEIARICEERGVDLLLPTFEDGFYLARYADKLPVPRFAAEFDVIEKLHNKASFVSLCQSLGLATPPTVIATNQEELKAAIAATDDFFARPAFSRAGIARLTNHGVHLEESDIAQCRPSRSNPWLVQSYVDGKDACIMCIARKGRPIAVTTYEPSLAAGGGYCVQFTSIEDPAAIEIASTVCEALDYTGFIGFDYRRTSHGPVLLECNPRVTAGVFLTDESVIGGAILNRVDDLNIAPAGNTRQYDSYLVYGGRKDHSAGTIVKNLLSAKDALISQRDYLPFFYSFIARAQYKHLAHEEHKAFTDIFLGDIIWDGTPLPPITSD